MLQIRTVLSTAAFMGILIAAKFSLHDSLGRNLSFRIPPKHVIPSKFQSSALASPNFTFRPASLHTHTSQLFASADHERKPARCRKATRKSTCFPQGSRMQRALRSPFFRYKMAPFSRPITRLPRAVNSNAVIATPAHLGPSGRGSAFENAPLLSQRYSQSAAFCPPTARQSFDEVTTGTFVLLEKSLTRTERLQGSRMNRASPRAPVTRRVRPETVTIKGD